MWKPSLVLSVEGEGKGWSRAGSVCTPSSGRARASSPPPLVAGAQSQAVTGSRGRTETRAQAVRAVCYQRDEKTVAGGAHSKAGTDHGPRHL